MTNQELAAEVRAVMATIDVKARVREIFPDKRFLDCFDGRVTILDNWPGQFDVVAVFIDVSMLPADYDGGNVHVGRLPWTHTKTDFAFSTREAFDDLPKIIRQRYDMAMCEWQEINLGAEAAMPNLPVSEHFTVRASDAEPV